MLSVNQSLLPLEQAIQLPNLFTGLDIVLLAVDSGTGEVRRDGDGNLVQYNFADTNWVPLMMRNSSFIIHPEEVLADNFATLAAAPFPRGSRVGDRPKPWPVVIGIRFKLTQDPITGRHLPIPQCEACRDDLVIEVPAVRQDHPGN